MEVHVIPPSPAIDFNFDSTSTSPYATAPSSPQSTIPFTWEEKPGIPKQNNLDDFEDPYADNDTDFAFGYLERHSISAADELFDCGKIKPLKPPPRLHCSNDSPRSPKSPKSPKLRFKEALSPRGKRNDFDPFSEAFKQTSGEPMHNQPDENDQLRGRERVSKSNRYKVSRSLSPFRVSDILSNRKDSKDQSSSAGLTWYNKWNLKNLLLFRSASEGSAVTRKKNQLFSFRSSDGSSLTSDKINEVRGSDKRSADGSGDSMKGSYKSGLMGCLRFHQNAGSVHEISRGISSVMKQ